MPNELTFSDLVVPDNKLDYYSRPEVSSTDIRNFITYGAEYYKVHKEKKSGSSKSFFDLGESFHCALLESDQFESRFYLAKHKIGGLMSAFITNLQMLEPIDPSKRSEAYKLAYERTGWKLTLDQVIKEFEKPNIKATYDEIQNNVGKIALNNKQVDLLTSMKQSLFKHKKAAELFNPSKSVTSVLNELEVYWTENIVVKGDMFDDIYTIECKSKIDKLLIDHVNKIVTIVDIKTTSKPLSSFPHYYKLYGYPIQMAYYKNAIKWWLEDADDDRDYSSYKINVFIVAVGTIWPYRTKVFTVSDIDLINGEKEYKQALIDIHWHKTNQIWQDRDSIEGRVEILEKTIDNEDGRYEEERVEDKDKSDL